MTHMTQANNDVTKLLTNTINNHLESTCENAVDMGQSCDNCFLENSELNSSVDTPNNRTRPLNEDVEDPLNEHRSLMPVRHACSQSFQIIPF